MPQELSWCRYQVLAASPGGPDRRRSCGRCWSSGRQVALAGIANISDAGLRRNTSTKSHYNREPAGRLGQPGAERASAKPAAARPPPKRPHAPPPAPKRPQAANLQEQFKRLLEIGTRLNELGDAEALPNFIIDELVELTGAERAALVLLDPDGARRVHAAHDSTAPLPAALDAWLPPEAGPVLGRRAPAGAAARSRRPGRLRRRARAAPPLGHGRAAGGPLAGARLAVRGQPRPVWPLRPGRPRPVLGLCQPGRHRSRKCLPHSGPGAARGRAHRRAGAARGRAGIINSVQQGLVAQLDFQAIIELVGDKLRDLFSGRDLSIRLYDAASNTVTIPYSWENGERMGPFACFHARRLYPPGDQTREPLLINTGLDEASDRYGSFRSRARPNRRPSWACPASSATRSSP